MGWEPTGPAEYGWVPVAWREDDHEYVPDLSNPRVSLPWEGYWPPWHNWRVTWSDWFAPRARWVADR